MTAETNTRIMERFTSEFLTTGDIALAEEFLSPDIVLHFAGQQQRGRDTYLAVAAANAATFEDLVWTVEEMVAHGDAVAVRYTARRWPTTTSVGQARGRGWRADGGRC